jgi:PKD repeat protein
MAHLRPRYALAICAAIVTCLGLSASAAAEPTISWSGTVSMTDVHSEHLNTCGPAGWRFETDWRLADKTVPLSEPDETGARTAVVHMVPTGPGAFALTHDSSSCGGSASACGYTAEWSNLHAVDAIVEPIAVEMLLYLGAGRLAIMPVYSSASRDWVLNAAVTRRAHPPCDTTPSTQDEDITQGFGLPRFQLSPEGFPERDDRVPVHEASPGEIVVDGPFTATGVPDIDRTLNLDGMPFGSWFTAFLVNCVGGNDCDQSEIDEASTMAEALRAEIHGLDRDGLDLSPPECPTPTAAFGAAWTQDENKEAFNGSISSSPFPSNLVAWTWDFGDGKTGSGVAPLHPYAESGIYEVTLTVRNGCGAEAKRTDEVTVNAPVVYAPEVHFHPKEDYFPGDADAFIRGSRLLWDKPEFKFGCRDDVVAPSPDSVRLGAASEGPYRHADTVAGFLGAGCRSKPKVTKLATDPTARHAPGDRHGGFVLDATHVSRAGRSEGAPVYYEYTPDRWIVYWFFYPYNGWSTAAGRLVERHEGDWEHIAVRLDGRDHLVGTAFAQHNCPVKSTSKTSFSGTHPIVFSAHGGHASYPTNGKGGVHALECTDGLNVEGYALFDTTGRGKVWRTWEGDEKVPVWERVKDVRAEDWYGFGGSWGDIGDGGGLLHLKKCLCYYGPPGPSQRKVYAPPGALPAGW